MIEYAKTILPKVCGWKTLFRKELIKCYKWMPENEIPILYSWCYVNYYQLYPDVLEDVFKNLPPKSEIKQNLRFAKKVFTAEEDIFASSA